MNLLFSLYLDIEERSGVGPSGINREGSDKDTADFINPLTSSGEITTVGKLHYRILMRNNE